MRSSDSEEIAVAFKALASAVDAVLELDFEALTTPERFAYLQQCEQARRRLPAIEHPLINGIRQQATPAEVSPSRNRRPRPDLALRIPPRNHRP